MKLLFIRKRQISKNSVLLQTMHSCYKIILLSFLYMNFRLKLSWLVLHLPYFPDLAPCDFSFFTTQVGTGGKYEYIDDIMIQEQSRVDLPEIKTQDFQQWCNHSTCCIMLLGIILKGTAWNTGYIQISWRNTT